MIRECHVYNSIPYLNGLVVTEYFHISNLNLPHLLNEDKYVIRRITSNIDNLCKVLKTFHKTAREK